MERITRRGIVFSLDAAIAVTIVLILLVNTSYYFSTASRESVSQLHLIRIGNDVMHMLDLTGELRKAIVDDYAVSPQMNPLVSRTTVNVSKYIPEGYDMKVIIFDQGETEINLANARNAVDGGGCNSLQPNPQGTPVGCTCDTKGCNGTFNVTTPALEKSALYGFRLNITTYGNMTVNISSFGGQSPALYYTTTAALMPENYSGMDLANVLLLAPGENNLLFKTVNATVHWFTILGAKEYAGATPENVPLLVNESFIGSGEKLLSLNETNYLDFGRLVRYHIWVK